MTYNITLQYRIEATSPIEAQQKAIANETQPTSVQVREIPTRPGVTKPEAKPNG